MGRLFLYNTGFELELASGHPWQPAASMTANLICQQLQYLPFLVAKPQDVIAVTARPEANYHPQLTSTLVASREPIEASDSHCWAMTPKIVEWGKTRGLNLSSPTWDTLERVNSKTFSYDLCPPLPQSALLFNEEELTQWRHKASSSSVLKHRFGVAGTGKKKVEPNTPLLDLQKFCQKEWDKGHPVIAEPWAERAADFSSQWHISPNQRIELLGITVLNNTPGGVYRSTTIMDETALPSIIQSYLPEHLTHAEQATKKVAEAGYWGPVGIDAMVYHYENHVRLHPILEINARFTMSAFALLFRNQHLPNQTAEISYTRQRRKEKPLLPTTFPYQLYLRSW